MNKLYISGFLDRYIASGSARFHMPGHKGFEKWNEQYDITEIEGADNLLCPQGIIDKAQRQAAIAFGAAHTFFLTGGSTAGVLVMLLSLPLGAKVVLSRDCHKSAINALALGAHEPVFVYPEYDEARQIYGVVSAHAIKVALDENPDAAAVFITRPDYNGWCCDIIAIARECKEHGVLLLVDEAHGAHFPFSDALPQSASVCADLWTQSAHKSLRAFNQAAYLHIREGVDVDRIANAIQMVHTTSPSYPILSSLETAIAYAKGEWDAQSARAFTFMHALPIGYKDANASACAGVVDCDVTRMVIDVTGRGLTGFAAAKLLLKSGVVMECADLRCVCAITSPADPDEWYDRLKRALEDIPYKAPITLADKRFDHQAVRKLSVREASFAPCEKSTLRNSVGRICAKSMGVYPPGSALVTPGEIIDEQVIEYMLEYKKEGVQLFGVPAMCVKTK